MDSSLRITFVLPGRGLAGGIRVVVIYANKLLARGHNVTIVINKKPWPRRPVPLLTRIYREFAYASGFSRDHVQEFRGRLLFTRPKRFAEVVPDGDIVLATHWLTANPVFDLPLSKGRRCYFIQHYEAHSFDQSMVDATWRLPMRKIVVAQWLRDLARERFDDDTALVVPNGVDLERFDAPPRAMHEPPRVGLMYSQKPWKGGVLAFEAIRVARQSIPNLCVVCLGIDRPDKRLPVPPNTEFYLRPAQNRLRDVYARADAWLLPSTIEGFGLPGLEAMACRCPVVSTRCGGPTEFVQDGVNGYLVRIGDAEEMADRIVRLVSDKAVHRRFSDAAYGTRFRFDLKRSALAFEHALLSACHERSSAKPQAEAAQTS